MKVTDFKAKRFIGMGAYSLVYEVELKDDFHSKSLYALKRTGLRTKLTIKRVLRERKVLEIITTDKRSRNSPFLPKLYAAFMISRLSSALVTPAGSGVDLYALWKAYRPFSEREVLFYAAEIICGLKALHALHIVHVDLKSCNVIIMPSGHVMIIDFDHALDISSGPRQHSDKHVGTVMYRPPEVANVGVISEKSDVWSWAIILLELLCHNDFIQEVVLYLVRIKKACIHLFCTCSKALMNLLLWCFEECPHDRPCLIDIQNHDFFRGLKWKDVESCKLEPPERLDASRCYRNPMENDSLVLENLKKPVMIIVSFEITNGIKIPRYDWEKYDEESVNLYLEYKHELTNFDFVHPDEFQFEKKKVMMKEKKSTFCKCC